MTRQENPDSIRVFELRERDEDVALATRAGSLALFVMPNTDVPLCAEEFVHHREGWIVQTSTRVREGFSLGCFQLRDWCE